MRKLLFWKLFTNITTYTLGVLIILYIFLKKYSDGYLNIWSIIAGLLLVLSLIGELMEFLIKKSLRNR
jgi:hypothetical protein